MSIGDLIVGVVVLIVIAAAGLWSQPGIEAHARRTGTWR